MTTRRVRGESGAIFEVDTSMLDDRPQRERGYREACALPRASDINRPAPPPPIPNVVIALLVVELALFVLALVVRG